MVVMPSFVTPQLRGRRFGRGARRRYGLHQVGIVLVCAVALVACGSSSSVAHQAKRTQPPAPPVIKEQFTPLPCPRDRAARRTTIGSEGCAEKKIVRTDAKINARARVIFGLLRDTTAKRRFVVAERTWFVYRQASCRSVAD